MQNQTPHALELGDRSFGSLPNGWIRTSVSEVFDVVGGGTPSTSIPEYWKGDIDWITSADIDEVGRITPRRKISPEAIKNSATNLVPSGTIIVVTRVGLGKVAVVPSPLCFSQDSQALLRGSTNLNPHFAAYQLRQSVRVFKHIGRGTTINGVTKRQLLGLDFLIAPAPEQERIVNEIEKEFTRLDAAVAALKRILANLKRYRASVLKAACEGRLVPTEAELARAEDRDYEPADRLLARILKERRAKWEGQSATARKRKYIEPLPADTSSLPDLPEGWTWASVEQLGMVQLGRQRSPKNRSKDHPVQYLRAANITEAGLDLSDVYDMEFSPEEQERYRLRNGDLVLSEASGSADQVGKPAVWRDQLPTCCFQNTVIRLRPVLNLSNYLVVCFKSYYASGVFAKVAGGVGINHLSAERFSRVVVPLAPIDEQHRIVTEVERRLSVVEELDSTVTAALRRAQRLRQSVLKRAFEGKLVPQGPGDEPASALLERIRAERERAPGRNPPKTRSRPNRVVY